LCRLTQLLLLLLLRDSDADGMTRSFSPVALLCETFEAHPVTHFFAQHVRPDVGAYE